MKDSYLRDRRQALEEAFFARKNKELLEQVREDLNVEHRRDALKLATGIDDDAVLKRIVELGVSVESLAALAIAPLVLVAWADGSMDEKERKAILSGAQQSGIKSNSTAAVLLEGWLSNRPDVALHDAWTSYTRAVCRDLLPGDQVNLRNKVLGRCQRVAEAAGGFLGLGSISVKEQQMLETLAAAFDSY